MRFYDRQAFHEYEGVAIDLDEQARLVRDLGPHKVMLMRNHGILTVCRTPGEAFMLLYYFERAAHPVADAGRDRRRRRAGDAAARGLREGRAAVLGIAGRYP